MLKYNTFIYITVIDIHILTTLNLTSNPNITDVHVTLYSRQIGYNRTGRVQSNTAVITTFNVYCQYMF